MSVPPESSKSARREAGGYSFPRRLRVLRQADFTRAMKQGRRAVDERVTLWAVANGLEYSRFGLTVGRKHGNAVRRNRIKRVLREAFRLSQHELPGGFDLVCAPRTGGEITLTGCMESLARLAGQLARRCRGQ